MNSIAGAGKRRAVTRQVPWAVLVLAACAAGGLWRAHQVPPAAAQGCPALGQAGRIALFVGTNEGAVLCAGTEQRWSTLRRGGDGAMLRTLTVAGDGRTIYAGSSGGPLVERSVDGGAHWSTVSRSFGKETRVTSLAASAANASSIFAGTDAGLFLSTDGGATWTMVTNGLPATQIASLAVDAHTPASMWAGTEGNGLFHSGDYGKTWSGVPGLPDDVAVQTIVVSPVTSNVIYVGTFTALYRSVDGGKHWTASAGRLKASVESLAVSPLQPTRIYAGTDEVIAVSTDGGDSWAAGKGLPRAPVWGVAADPRDALMAYAATYRGLYRTLNGGATWTAWSAGGAQAGARALSLALTFVRHTAADPVSPTCCGVFVGVPPATSDQGLYFSRTGHNIGGPFLTYWRRYGGLDTFGYPRTEPFEENDRLVQYTERFLLVMTGGRVTTAPLGRLLTAGRSFAPVAPFPSTSTHLFVASTEHSLAGPFLTYWRDHHGMTLLGAPISEVVREANGDGTGRVYQMQWFERGRLEYHAELAGTRYSIEMGLEGKQALQRRGWLP